MKVESIKLSHIKIPFRTPFSTAGRTYTHQEVMFVEVFADGLVGIGDSVAKVPFYSSESRESNRDIIKNHLAPRVLGKKLDDIAAYNAAIEIDPIIKGNYMAKATLEMAFWDLFAQRANMSLKDMFGGTKTRVKAGVSIGLQADPRALLEVVDKRLGEGIERIKLKIRPGKDVDYVRTVREAFPDIILQADGNSSYSLEHADHLKQLDAYNLLLLEQPLSDMDIYRHSKLAPKLKTPICLDESIHTFEDAEDALEMKACSIVNIKPARVGGLWNAKKIHDLCFKLGIPVWMGGMFETGVGNAACLALASLPGFTIPGDHSWEGLYLDWDIIEEPPHLNSEDSTVSVPTGIGLGVSINRKALERATISSETFKAAS